MITSKPKIFFLLLSAGMIFTLVSCNSSTPETDEETTIITPVTITTVNFKNIKEEIKLPAVSAFLSRNIIRSTTSGVVESVEIIPGDYIKEGKTLFILKTKEASLLSSNSGKDTSFAFKGEIRIRASEDGVINSISHQKGDFVQEGDELAVISDESGFVFTLETPYELGVYAERNKICRILLPDGKTIDASIIGRLPEMDPQAQTTKFLLKPTGIWHLPANLNAMVTIIKESKDRAAVLPKTAILGNETQTEFWIMRLINDTTAVKIMVKKGLEINEEVEITEPELLTSDRIVVTGGYGLPDTARVIIKQIP